jgi:A/G-specific adenine glycosylase
MPRPEDATAPPAAQVAMLHAKLLRWYAAERRDLPWRRTRDPYAIWVSEIMLQQTRVETVIPYYERFLARFPTAMALAEAPEDDVLALWSGLGYYRRARLLHAGARAVAERGEVPRDREGLLSVPGIGRYTAGAVASIAFGEPVGLVDGNVARVLARVFAIEDDMRKAGMRRAEALADAIVAARDPGSWNQALMELGATICTPQRPSCEACPIASSCRARAEARVAELPVLAAKKKPEERRVQALVATARTGEVLLLQRKRDRLFGGLWEPPCFQGSLSARRDLVKRFGAKEARPCGRVTHVLSHRKLTIDVVRGGIDESALAVPLPDDYDDARLVAPSTFEGFGIATLARKILRAGMIE